MSVRFRKSGFDGDVLGPVVTLGANLTLGYAADGSVSINATTSGVDWTQGYPTYDARYAPLVHASRHATGGADPLTPAAIGAVPTSRQVNSGVGLSGGGDLSANRTLAFDTVWGDARYLANQGVGTQGQVLSTDGTNIGWTVGGATGNVLTRTASGLAAWAAPPSGLPSPSTAGRFPQVTGGLAWALSAWALPTVVGADGAFLTGGGAGVSQFRALIASDVPDHDAGKITTGTISYLRLPYSGQGPTIQGNFGQWQNHGTFTDFNTALTYWGGNYVSGSTNAPNATSSQWYRLVLSLGSEYAIGSYRLELALPRYNHASAGVHVRTMETGVLGAWTGLSMVGHSHDVAGSTITGLLPVTKGGTGLTTASNGAVMAGNGSAWVATTPSGSDLVLHWNGSLVGWRTIATLPAGSSADRWLRATGGPGWAMSSWGLPATGGLTTEFIRGGGGPGTTATWSALTATDIPTLPASKISAGTFGAGVFTFSSDIAISGNGAIRRTTADGADNGSLALTGGGAFSTARGACIGLYGNEHANLGGIYLYGGATASAHMYFFPGGTEKGRWFANGNLMVGYTTDQGYRLAVNGNAYLSGTITSFGSFTHASLRSMKRDVRPLPLAEARAILRGTELYRFRYRKRWDDGKEHAGFMVDDAHDLLVSPERTHVDDYAFATVIAGAVQDIDREIGELKARVRQLEALRN